MKRLLPALLIMALLAALVYTVTLMPPMGSADNPTAVNTIPRYFERGAEEAGTENIVTGIVLNYRGYDTMGEVTVIFSALTAVLAVITRGEKRPFPNQNGSPEVRPTLFIRTVTGFLIPFIILFSFYVILHGDVSPGGGFQGGAIIGAVLIISAMVFGPSEFSKLLPDRARIPFEGTAVITFFVTGILGVLSGTNFLTYILPGIAPGLQPILRTLMLLFLEAGIGIGGAVIFVSIFFAMLKEE